MVTILGKEYEFRLTLWAKDQLLEGNFDGAESGVADPATKLAADAAPVVFVAHGFIRAGVHVVDCGQFEADHHHQNGSQKEFFAEHLLALLRYFKVFL